MTISKNVPCFLTGEEFSKEELLSTLELAEKLKMDRANGICNKTLDGKTLVLYFDKPSLRTRLSFMVAMNELGGHVIESVGSSRKTEEPEDTIRVLGGYAHGVMIRTHAHKFLERMKSATSIPIVNGLSDSHHPCQALADLMTLKEHYKSLAGLTFTFLGDGNNVLHSLMLLLPFLGVHLRYACPQGYEPSALIVKTAKQRATVGGGSITAHSNPKEACKDSNALYTDVWTSMGFESEESTREAAFEGFCLNESLLKLAAPGALVMHCMPMVRGQEISETLPDHPQSVIFEQSENRMHVQKALLQKLMNVPMK